MDCREFEHLLSDYAEGTLPEHSLASVQKHLEQCSRCSREVEELQSYFEAMRKLDTVEPPADFLGSIHKHLERKSIFQRLFLKLFGVEGRRMPLEYAGLTVTVILVMTVYIAVFNPVKRQADKYKQVSREVQEEKEAPAPVMADKKEAAAEKQTEEEMAADDMLALAEEARPVEKTAQRKKVGRGASLKGKQTRAARQEAAEALKSRDKVTEARSEPAGGGPSPEKSRVSEKKQREEAAPREMLAAKPEQQQLPAAEKETAVKDIASETAGTEAEGFAADEFMDVAAAEAPEPAAKPSAPAKSAAKARPAVTREENIETLELALNLFKSEKEEADAEEERAYEPAPEAKSKKAERSRAASAAEERAVSQPPDSRVEQVKKAVAMVGGTITGQTKKVEATVLEITIPSGKYRKLMRKLRKLGTFDKEPREKAGKDTDRVLIKLVIKN
jgi:hypothetical protein